MSEPWKYFVRCHANIITHTNHMNSKQLFCFNTKTVAKHCLIIIKTNSMYTIKQRDGSTKYVGIIINFCRRDFFIITNPTQWYLSDMAVSTLLNVKIDLHSIVETFNPTVCTKMLEMMTMSCWISSDFPGR